MLKKLNVNAQDNPQTKFRLHIVISALILRTFILGIVRVADNGTPQGRLNVWGIVVQIVTAHVARLKRWGNTMVNVALNIIDTIFWFALFIITIMGAMGSHSVSSKALAAIGITRSPGGCEP
ncbi:hypothetical protein CPC735_000050 [Coccidioides posadasii C735 delta SOWgp]|uniref:MARVEL domain-containing protein n=2 Tax=Coccidioides posadasii TaxID=199306 RepID=A0A0J6IK69_COCPO|nr:hypothetical protein CPC735_000050 [Coccidioides posadasii C735 delta SOWgp]EER29749.1 hypothetical protein CPC735_000050 [Coccidioides posadasii C735 delta SOWgp]KMM72332.1 hypothetical protein CPAG_08629 [Coccidioides posadasii RMSCC 3488]|eukprot:XP_003071894.1 hypothetical protein CPC735_000050 [Coccidioides posadasii C735 delta SOWgp]